MGASEDGRGTENPRGSALRSRLRPERARLERGSSRRLTVMRRRSAYIRVINRRRCLFARGLPRRSVARLGGDYETTTTGQGLTGPRHIRPTDLTHPPCQPSAPTRAGLLPRNPRHSLGFRHLVRLPWGSLYCSAGQASTHEIQPGTRLQPVQHSPDLWTRPARSAYGLPTCARIHAIAAITAAS